ncbi:interferon-related developmental regulator 1 [Trichogramma pretiosum]|uniref:interferon-related developmental regulator 1 n=1 Tax=Trichogramma pretiosum TaxID=7493 RepID=UPI0006C99172|nr:interferon-related developmental regulator 1 [Trichogramma pretiosum]
MPGKGKRRKAGRRNHPDSDDESVTDTGSYISGSDAHSVLDEGNDNNEVEEIYEQDSYNDEIDGLTSKSAQSRVSHFRKVGKSFTDKYVPDFIEDRKFTLTDAIERSLKKGKGEEQSTAAKLSTLMCAQLGDYAEDVYKDLKPTMTKIANDNAASIAGRSECCWSLSMNQFLSGKDLSEFLELSQLLSNVFAGSYLKGNGAMAKVTPELAVLHAAAISSWTLLLTTMNSGDINNLLKSAQTNTSMPSLDQLSGLLQSPHLDVRMTAGEALAVIFELGRNYSEDYEQDWAEELVESLKELATDSNKFRAKKDKTIQRATFRDILRYIEEDITPETQIRFGKETLFLEGWCARTQYNACCRLLGPSINIHLTENQVLRDVFNLGNKIVEPIGDPTKKVPKFQKTLMNAAAFKARTKIRNKCRSKRSADLADEF